MIYIRNEKGIALVMVLAIAAMGLFMVSTLIYMVTKGTQISSGQRLFRTADEASIGGVETAVFYLANRGELNILGAGMTDGCDCGDPLDPNDNIDNMTGAASCRCEKLCNDRSDWPALCDENGGVGGVQVDLDPTLNADFTYTLGVNPNTFDVITKIVDTTEGNTDISGLVSGELAGFGVVASSTGIISPPHSPYLYRAEVQAQATTNVRERARVTVVYAY